MVATKYLKLGAAAFAVVAVVIGLSVGLTQSQRGNNDSLSAANGSANANVDTVNLEDACPAGKSGKSGGTKSGKSGDRTRRRLVVPGTEDYDPARVSPSQRRKLRNDLRRKLQGTDDGAGEPLVMDMEEIPVDDDVNMGELLVDDDTPADDTPADDDASGGVDDDGGSSGNTDAAGGAANAASGSTDGDEGAANQDEDEDYDYYDGDDDDDDASGTKSGKSGNKSGKSGTKSGKSGGGDACAFVYDPCDPDAAPRGKAGKSGGGAKSGKSGGGAKSGKSGGSDGTCNCPGNKSGKSGGNKSGKSGADTLSSFDGEGSDGEGSRTKSGKSGNKSGKSGGDGTCPCNPMPTLCPTPDVCVCADLPVIVVGGVCARGCDEPVDGDDALEYASMQECCDATFGATLPCDIRDQCPVTPAPTLAPTTAPPTLAPTTARPTDCVCDDLDIVFFDGQCRRECGLAAGPTYPTFRDCCETEFPGGDDCPFNDECPTDAPTSLPPTVAPTTPAPTDAPTTVAPTSPAPTYSPTALAAPTSPAPTYSPSVSATYSPTGSTTYSPTATIVQAAVDSPSPTSGSTPTVSTEATGPPTRPLREPRKN